MVLEFCNVKPTYRKSWARNLIMCLDLTMGSCQTRIGKFKSAFSSLIIGPRDLQYETKL